jgi:BirA family biotin operon repressor/biotin-[acetyl-CoA-carboxylase] ligase
MEKATRDTVPTNWDGHTAETLARSCGVPRFVLLGETDSTQDTAHALAEAGAVAGTTIVADSQRAGRGRLGRSWSSEPGLGVWCTVIERPDAGALDVLSLRVGLSVAEALNPFSSARVGLKWPNDLVIPRSTVVPSAARDLLLKLGGILVEARWSGSTLGWVAIGVGINVVAPHAVAGAAGLDHQAKRKDVLVAVVRAVRAAAAATGRFTDDELRRYRQRDALAGQRIISPVDGVVTGISARGALIVETGAGGSIEHVRAGTIQLKTEEHA